MVEIDHNRKQQCISHQQPMGALMPLSAASLFLVKAGWRVRLGTAVSQPHRYYQRQVAVSHTSLGWRCEVLMTHCVRDPPAQKDLRTMQRNSSRKPVAPRELITRKKKNRRQWFGNETPLRGSVNSKGGRVGDGLLTSLYWIRFTSEAAFCVETGYECVCALSKL